MIPEHLQTGRLTAVGRGPGTCHLLEVGKGWPELGHSVLLRTESREKG